jgi:hypothetical protein
VVKHETSPAFSLTLTPPLSQLPHVNSASATMTAKRKPPCLTLYAARDAYSSPGVLTTPGRRTRPFPLKPVRCSAFEGFRVNFVCDAAGSVAFDVAGPEPGGAWPVPFRRVNESAPRRGRGLGRGLYLRRTQPHRPRLGHDLDGHGRAPRLPPRRSQSRLRPVRRRPLRPSVIRGRARSSHQRASRRARARQQAEATTTRRAARAAASPLSPRCPVIN